MDTEPPLRHRPDSLPPDQRPWTMLSDSMRTGASDDLTSISRRKVVALVLGGAVAVLVLVAITGLDRGATSGREGVGPRRCAEHRPARRCGRAAGPARRPGLGEPRGPRRHGPGRPRPRARTVDDPREDLDARGTDHLLRRAQTDRTHLRPRRGGAGGPLPSRHPGGSLRPVPSGERLRAGAGQAARGVPPGVDTLGRSAADGDLRAVRRA